MQKMKILLWRIFEWLQCSSRCMKYGEWMVLNPPPRALPTQVAHNFSWVPLM